MSGVRIYVYATVQNACILREAGQPSGCQDAFVQQLGEVAEDKKAT